MAAGKVEKWDWMRAVPKGEKMVARMVAWKEGKKGDQMV